VTWQLDLNNADLPRSEKNFKFGVRKVPNPDRDFLENFWQFLRILDHFLVFSYGKTKHADFLIKERVQYFYLKLQSLTQF
jgi:hypothetical protein